MQSTDAVVSTQSRESVCYYIFSFKIQHSTFNLPPCPSVPNLVSLRGSLLPSPFSFLLLDYIKNPGVFNNKAAVIDFAEVALVVVQHYK